ncbi:tRNA (guanosine(37)-N1)-methyltransferase TrmD [Patescibacteria group bacterium]|nr:tRNA (guanosine(37)-N1)-methyltransferase TrmD [Patescibacteria group bacterium]
MTFHIVTIFPDIFDSYFNESILKRAQENKLIKIKIHDLRDWTADKHKTVDDTPYGGGAGMVMKVEPIHNAVSSIKYNVLMDKKNSHNTKYLIHNTKTILLSAKGKTWNQQMAKKYSKLDEIILICGRYEGVDERVKKFVDEEISIGDYVLTGGEIPAMAIVDSVTRLLPGVLGNAESAEYESHAVPGVLEYPQYTRPEIFEANEKKLRVPKVLLSGNHKEIEKWREKHSKKIIAA